MRFIQHSAMNCNADETTREIEGKQGAPTTVKKISGFLPFLRAPSGDETEMLQRILYSMIPHQRDTN